MAGTSNGERQARLRTVVRFMWIPLVVAALYVGGVFYMRFDRSRQAEQQQLEQTREEARRGYELMGGDRFEILQFYASPPAVRPGQTAQLCYGVSNAKAVRLEPPAGPVWPSLARCVNVAPQQDTTYTLTIEDAAGETKSQSVVVRVVPE